jgi:hypothetical protein
MVLNSPKFSGMFGIMNLLPFQNSSMLLNVHKRFVLHYLVLFAICVALNFGFVVLPNLVATVC